VASQRDTWPIIQPEAEKGSYHYPAVIQGGDGTIHFVYSYFVDGGKSMKHVAANEAWIRQGDGK
jgi:predicted neuraminidase